MAWNTDIKGLVIKSETNTFPQRKNLRFTGPNTFIDDNSPDSSTDVVVDAAGLGNAPESVFGRAGAVSAVTDDYSANLVRYNPAGTSLTDVNVQDAITTFADPEAPLFSQVVDSIPVKSISGETYAITADDFGYLLNKTGTGDTELTLNDTGFDIGSQLMFTRSGTGRLFFDTANTNIITQFTHQPEVRCCGGVCRIRKRDSQNWYIEGDTWAPAVVFAGVFDRDVIDPDVRIPITTTLTSGNVRNGNQWVNANGFIQFPVPGLYLVQVSGQIRGETTIVNTFTDMNAYSDAAESVIVGRSGASQVSQYQHVAFGMSFAMDVTSIGNTYLSFSTSSSEKITTGSGSLDTTTTLDITRIGNSQNGIPG